MPLSSSLSPPLRCLPLPSPFLLFSAPFSSSALIPLLYYLSLSPLPFSSHPPLQLSSTLPSPPLRSSTVSLHHNTFHLFIGPWLCVIIPSKRSLLPPCNWVHSCLSWNDSSTSVHVGSSSLLGSWQLPHLRWAPSSSSSPLCPFLPHTGTGYWFALWVSVFWFPSLTYAATKALSTGTNFVLFLSVPGESVKLPLR